MKFLCVKCDESMRFQEVSGPEEGSISITFCCSLCGNRVTLLTNPGETQLVKALDVRIGSPENHTGPMGLVRGVLARQRAQAFAQRPNASPQEKTAVWTDAAEKRLENVPGFVREMARKAIERYALEQGCIEITSDVMDRAREKNGV